MERETYNIAVAAAGLSKRGSSFFFFFLNSTVRGGDGEKSKDSMQS